MSRVLASSAKGVNTKMKAGGLNALGIGIRSYMEMPYIPLYVDMVWDTPISGEHTREIIYYFHNEMKQTKPYFTKLKKKKKRNASIIALKVLFL